MKNLILIFLNFIIIFSFFKCNNEVVTSDLKIEKRIIDEEDDTYGHYFYVKPAKDSIKSVLVLFPGFTQNAEKIFEDSDLHKEAYKNNILTIGFAGKMRFTADSLLQTRISAVLKDVITEFKIENNNFILGGFSAGGVIALRYVELCKQYPNKYPIDPKAVFMADSPVDLFHFWNLSQEIMKNNFSEISVKEAKMIEQVFRFYYQTTPSENPEIFKELSPFSIDEKYGQNEKYLKNVAVRAYHDVDIPWRLKNRNQTARFDNYVASSELINRLLIMGNKNAEFVQATGKGYRKNGDRHPHSWSIIDAKECIDWINKIIDK